jgi:hypothetical protein
LPLFRAAIELLAPFVGGTSRSTGVLEYWSIGNSGFSDTVLIFNPKEKPAAEFKKYISILGISITPILQYSNN